MSFTIRPAQRGNVNIVCGLAGPSGGGKTYSALKLARGLAGAGKIVLIDSEHGRSQMYADIGSPWEWIDFEPPFSPERYVEALKAAEAHKPAVIVVDSISHEYEGEGGLFDIVEEHLKSRAGDDSRKRAALSFQAWNVAKLRHKRLLLHMLRVPCHLLVCMRAQDKIELVKEGGQLKAVPKKSLTGLDGWEPICERRLPYEMTCSFLFLPDKPGIPRPLKPMPPSMLSAVRLDRAITEETGRALAAWAAGSPAKAESSSEPSAELTAEADALLARLIDLSDRIGNREAVGPKITEDRQKNGANLAGHVQWLRRQVERAGKAAAALEESRA